MTSEARELISALYQCASELAVFIDHMGPRRKDGSHRCGMIVSRNAAQAMMEANNEARRLCEAYGYDPQQGGQALASRPTLSPQDDDRAEIERLTALLSQAREDERGAVVRWLRDGSVYSGDGLLEAVAHEIESGEHSGKGR